MFQSLGYKAQAEQALSELRPEIPLFFEANDKREINCGELSLKINDKGGIESLRYGENEFIRENEEALITYRSFSDKDYQYWLSHYSRDLHETAVWALGDFARPNLKIFEGKYPSGRFDYRLEKISATENRIILNLTCDRKLREELGAPGLIQVVYTLRDESLLVDVSWFNKDANRLTEAIYLNLFPNSDNVLLKKLGSYVRPEEVTLNGSRNLHAVQSVSFDGCEITNLHAPLVSFGRGKILEFDNKLESVSENGISFVLQNNVWGTNFPLWYEDNARFAFEIKLNK